VKLTQPRLQGVFTSGYPLSEPVLAEIDRHGMAFLPKPFQINEFLEMVSLLLWQGGNRATTADHFFSSGRMKQCLGDWPGARHDLDQAIALDPHDAEAYNHRSEVKWDLADYAGAVADGSAAIHIQPAYKEAFFNRGVARSASSDLHGAVADFNQTLEFDPGFGLAYYHRAAIKWIQCDRSGALDDMNQAEAASGFHPPASFYEERGDIKLALGNLDGAIADFTRAIEQKAKCAPH
jgi:lipoprotein NlpI